RLRRTTFAYGLHLRLHLPTQKGLAKTRLEIHPVEAQYESNTKPRGYEVLARFPMAPGCCGPPSSAAASGCSATAAATPAPASWRSFFDIFIVTVVLGTL